MTPEEMADAICATFKGTEDDRKCCHVVAVAMIRQAIAEEQRSAFILGMRNAAALVGLSAKEKILVEVSRLERK